MKKRIVLVGLIVLMMTGCSVNLKRGVKDNTFYSTYPELAIKMAPEFEYVNQEKSNEFTQGDYSEILFQSGSNYVNEYFLFEDRLTRRGGTIIISRLNGTRVYWDPDVASYIKNLITSGYEEHQGYRYQYSVFPITNKDDSCSLAKLSARVAGGRMDTMLEVLYFEPVSDLPRECRQWEQNMENLNDAQKKIIAQLMENSARHMEFIELAELKLEK